MSGFDWFEVKFVSFLDGRWTEVLFGYILISEVLLVTKSKIDVKKINKVVKT